MSNFGLDVRQIGHFASAIDDQENLLVAAVEVHEIVDDAARVVQQQTVALFADFQAQHIGGNQALERRSSVGPDQIDLPHVRDIKQARRRARVLVLGHQTRRVLHGHAVARKGNHARTEFEVQIV